MSKNSDGQANLAFESIETDEQPSQVASKATNVPNVPESSEQEEPSTSPDCRLFGLVRLPQPFQRLFLNAAWILVFLSLASTIQVIEIHLIESRFLSTRVQLDFYIGHGNKWVRQRRLVDLGETFRPFIHRGWRDCWQLRYWLHALDNTHNLFRRQDWNFQAKVC